MNESGVDDAVRVRGSTLQAVEIVERAAPHSGAGRGERFGACIGASKADDRMPCMRVFVTGATGFVGSAVVGESFQTSMP